MTAETANNHPPRVVNDRLLSVALFSLMVSELLWLVTRSDIIEAIAGGVLVLSILLTAPRFGIRETLSLIHI